MSFKIVCCLILICLITCKESANCNKERKCGYSRVLGRKAADCYRMDWKEFPKCLSSNVEVIDLTYNRIRKVTREDLQRYTSVTHLYLSDNLIVRLDDDTFEDLKSLETLDLSMNSLARVPPTVFQLPSLKILYLSKNMNINIAESINEATEVSYSPLTRLDISYLTEDDSMIDFPDFSPFSLLATLNISGDNISFLTTAHFANLCNLQILVNENVTTSYSDGCDCWRINQWLQERKVQFTPFNCPLDANECSVGYEELMEPVKLRYEKCRERLAEIKTFHVWQKVAVWAPIAAGVCMIAGGVVCYMKWKKTRGQRKAAMKLAAEKRSIALEDEHLINNPVRF